MSEDVTHKGRRKFLVGAGGLAAAAGAFWLTRQGDGVAHANEDDPDAIRAAALRRYRTLGRTGLKVSSIGVGTGGTTPPGVISQCIDLGLNYIDTAHVYGNGSSETAVGKVLKKRRKEVVLTTKWPKHANNTAQFTKTLDTSLKRLQTDHVDFVLVHAVDGMDRLHDDVYEAFAKARKAGKVSHLGLSGHGPNLEKILNHVIKVADTDRRFEMVLIKYSFMDYKRLGAIVDQMHAKGIGVTVMKTRAGARHVDLAEFQKGDGFLGATLRWASSNPKVGSAVISTGTFNDASLFAKIAGQELAAADVKLLEGYARRFDEVQCRWCGDCGSACPEQVPVWDVDRAAMYYSRYGEERKGMELYARLGQPAAACADCSAPCESACGYGLDIREQMAQAHATLRWDPPAPDDDHDALV